MHAVVPCILHPIYYIAFCEKSCIFYVYNVVIEIIDFNWIFLVRIFGFVAMMPCCVVPSCTSGYGSNPERVNFFTIPKVPECEKIWKTAIRPTDNAVKSGRAVYERHFLENQINMRKREFFDTNGRVIGVVSTIKCIYLY